MPLPERLQQIDIYLKYVGKLDVPMPKLTPEQIKEEERKRCKRAWNRTYARRKYEREKAEREAKEKELSEAVSWAVPEITFRKRNMRKFFI